MLEKLLDEALNIIKTYWYRRSTLVIIGLVIVGASLSFFSAIKIEEVSLLGWVSIILILLFVVLFWAYSVRLPKAVRGKIGFAVAIVPETKEQEEKISADFVITLRELLQNSNLKYHFSFIQIPVHFAQKIQSPEDAVKILRDSQCHFMVYGRARTRNIQDKETQIINLNGIVAHKPIPQETQKLLSAEFSELFPQKLFIPEEGDVFSFEVTAALINIVANYIIGISALVSGDFQYSQQLFERVEQEAKSFQSDIPSIVKIRQRIPSRLAEVYTVRARVCYLNWRSTKAPNLMDEMKIYLDLLGRVAPKNITGHVLRSIYLFVVNRDVAGAIEECEESRCSEDITWRYNYAFLNAYKGNMKKARAEYKRASKLLPRDPGTLLEIENFISWMLEKEPDRTQLHFCLGHINFFSKGDKASALLDFEKFLETTPIDQFSEERRLAEEYIKTIRGNPKSLPPDDSEIENPP